MKFKQQILIVLATCIAVFGMSSCQQPGKNSTGSEFVPDMVHGTAYEANVLTKYDFNSFDEESVLSRRQLSEPRLPVNGTIPRGYMGSSSYNGVYASAEDAVVSTMNRMKKDGGIAYTASGHVAYTYPDTEPGRTLASQQIRYNPFAITESGLAKGKELYNIFCGICHGEKADGNGYLVRDGSKYPAQPANMVDSQFVFSTNGRYYHAIMYGKNAMGAYADKLSFEERWQVIHYIRSLQAATRKATYSEKANSMVAEYGFPAALLPPPAPIVVPTEAPKTDAHSDGETGHSTTGQH